MEVQSPSTPHSGAIAVPVRFVALNRGIIIAAVYGSALFCLAVLNAGVVSPGNWTGWSGALLIGFISGSIGAFSNSDQTPGTARNQNVSDAAMIVVWTVVLSSTFNLTYLAVLGTGWHPLRPAYDLLACLAGFAGGTMIGGVVGESTLRSLAAFPVRGQRPFMAVAKATDRIEHRDLRFVVRVLSQSAALLILTFLAYVALMIVLVLLALAAILWLVVTLLSGNTNDDSAADQPAASATRRSPLAGKRFAQDGLLGDKRSDVFVAEDGRIMKDGIFGGQATGMKVNEDGQVVKEGLFGDTSTGIRYDQRDDGGLDIVKEGFFDQRTGRYYDKDGNEREEGIISDRYTGKKIVDN